jgi:2'-hydroxyisoflavone reductase
VRILILGGTVFLGRNLVDAALARGHTVTLFNRGQHNPDLYPEVEKLRGDRDGALGALEGRDWDAVIDTSGYVPRIVQQSARLLAGAVARYAFISTISVYADQSRPGTAEDTPLQTLTDASVEEVNGETYGGLKALCERVVEESLPGRGASIRAGLIVGPHDQSGRFTYWPRRVARGGEVLAPGRPERGVQIIDVRDLAEWTVRLVEDGGTGVYNATGPERPLPMAGLLDACRAVSGSDARFVWMPDQFLLDAGIGPWMEMPLWVPEKEDSAGFMAVDCSRAIAAGLAFRPLEETVRATLEWDTARPPEDPAPPAGLQPAREAEVLRAWHAARETPV